MPEKIEAQVFIKHVDGTIEVKEWLHRAKYSLGMITLAEHDFIRREGNELVIYVVNGYARYRIESIDPDTHDAIVNLVVSERVPYEPQGGNP